MKLKFKSLVALVLVLGFLGVGGVSLLFFVAASNLPQMITLQDYKPLVVSEVYGRGGEKIGDFYRERRTVVPFKNIPKILVQAFISAEDSKFFEHKGINFAAILRATIANVKAGHSVQGGSTITQQVAKSLMLTRERNFSRKAKEAILAYRMEKNLSKEDILFLYLNQIYLGHGAWGVESAAQTYFRKHVGELTLAEAAIIAGLPPAPSTYSPDKNPNKAKERQLYVLHRMAEEGYIKPEEEKAAAAEPLKVYFHEEFDDLAPHFRETVRQFLVARLGEEKVLDEGIKIYTTLDVKKQQAAEVATEKYLRELDKRQGFRGAHQNLATAEEMGQFLVKERDELMLKALPYRIVSPDGKEPPKPPLDLNRKEGAPNRPIYLKNDQIADGVVTNIDSPNGLVTVRVAETQGLIDIEEMGWARKPDTNKLFTEDVLKDPAKALKVGDVIRVKVKAEKFSSKRLAALQAKQAKNKKKPEPSKLPKLDEYLHLTLEQEPIVQAAVISFDLRTNEVVTMVGGYDFEHKKLNRSMQATRQTGSSFKPLVYAAALEKGFTPATTIVDAPIVFEEGEGQETKKWKPGNYSEKFSGDVLFRTALIKSLNIPTVKILEKIGIDWVSRYARRLGVFSPLNSDFTMGLGSSGLTLYEITKAYSVFARAGRRIDPILIKRVTDSNGQSVLAENIVLDDKFRKELDALGLEFGLTPLSPADGAANNGVPAVGSAAPATPPLQALGSAPTPGPDGKEPFDAAKVLHFGDRDQLISPQTAYLITDLMKGVINEGTGGRAKALGRPVAGKTGTTNGYIDAWFVGFTPFIATGVWVGFDNPSTLGKMETGASAALPIWVDYMNVATADDPPADFQVPPGIVFANIDSETGKLATSKTRGTVREAFREGTEPGEASNEPTSTEDKDFYKQDLSE